MLKLLGLVAKLLNRREPLLIYSVIRGTTKHIWVFSNKYYLLNSSKRASKMKGKVFQPKLEQFMELISTGAVLIL